MLLMHWALCTKNMVGNCKWSDVTVFSFHPVKTITTIEGGIATTNDFKIYNKMQMFRTHGITRTKAFLINSKKKEMIGTTSNIF